MNLLRYRPRTTDLHLPNGARVKVEVSDDAYRQHVHDPQGRVHATVRPEPIRIQVNHMTPKARGFLGRLGRLRADWKATKGSKAWIEDEDMRLWVPLPDDVCDPREQPIAPGPKEWAGVR